MNDAFQDLLLKPVAFKEWSLVCQAMQEGKHHLILRKGGIHEGKLGFSFQNRAFFLYPTDYHNQPNLLREDFAATAEPESLVRFRCWAELAATRAIVDWEIAAKLGQFHVWKEEVIRERFEWGKQLCLHLALVRVHLLEEPWTLPYSNEFSGCKSWITLPSPPATLKSKPVISDRAFEDIAGFVMESII